MSDFHGASPKMDWLRLCRPGINVSTETEIYFVSFNGELRWMWNPV